MLILFICIIYLFNVTSPSQAHENLQVDSRIDAYDIFIEGNYIYVVGNAVNLGTLPSESLKAGGGMLDIYVAKHQLNGDIVYQALIGGKGNDIAYAVSVQAGVVYILGETWSSDFPGAPGNAGENDAIILALSADGGQIQWARRFGGSDQDAGRALEIHGNALYLTGITWSSDFLVGSAKGDADGFLARMDLQGGLDWIQIFGGRGFDAPFGIAISSSDIWVAGSTFSSNLAGPLLGDGDIFVMKFDHDGNQELAGLYGGNGEDVAYAIKLAGDGGVHIVGDTRSSDLPLSQDNFIGKVDAFYMKINANGNPAISTYLGGQEIDSGSDIEVLPDGQLLIAGSTRSLRFPEGTSLSSPNQGGADAFIALLTQNGELQGISMIGGSGEEEARGISISSEGIVITGKFGNDNLKYLDFVSGSDFTEIVLPTQSTSIATATKGFTATPLPTETPIPSATSEIQSTPINMTEIAPGLTPEFTPTKNPTDQKNNEEQMTPLLTDATSTSVNLSGETELPVERVKEPKEKSSLVLVVVIGMGMILVGTLIFITLRKLKK
jgi:hypothetical protein